MFNNVLPKLGLSLAIGIALVLALPILVIAAYLALPTDEIWQHLADTVLSDYLRNTVILVLGVGMGVLLLGLPTAWLSSMCEFPGRTWFEWALLLPLAMPAYIIAYTYTGMLDFPVWYKAVYALGLVGKHRIIGFPKSAHWAVQSACCHWYCFPMCTY